jgi:murein DD-endopeptidase MepM/ murein hydrolase activator NlpD
MRHCFLALLKGIPLKSSLIVGAAGMLLAGCSSSIDRFADYPGESDRTHTASTPRSSGSASSDDYIQSSTLDGAPVRSAGSNPYQPPIYGKPQAYSQPQSYGETQYDRSPPPASGGSVIIEPGQTLYSIARANGMTVAALASTNGIHPPYHLRAGQRIIVPGVDEPRATAANAPGQQNFSQKSTVHTVRSGETLFSLGRNYGLHPYKIADFNEISHNASLSTGQKIRIPGGKSADRLGNQDSFAPAAEPDNQYSEEQYSEEQNSDKTDYVGDTEIAYAPADDEETAPEEREEQSDSLPVEEESNSFRWPVKGRIISKYGSKPGGTRNEGINIAVPEGTSVRAAEGGVIAYAGNELKGYGNLVLIRHEGGWVTAYAHNKQLFVKRGDTVRRGDVIAKAGQTGSVETPQLHFELRRGATAVDPLKYLVSSQAANN